MSTFPVQTEFNGTLTADEPMGKHTSWRVGGPADWFYKPANLEDLAKFLKQVPQDIPVTWIGLGSNVLVRDGGIRGVVVATHGVLSNIERQSETTVYAQAGVPCAKIARRCAQWGLGPAEFFAGIPGTLGGALAMNAGAFGGETWECVERVEIMTREGDLMIHDASEFDVGYRSVKSDFSGWFVAAWLCLTVEQPTDAGQIKDLLVRRKESQPIGLPSCGSVFVNPSNDYAARLIQAAGLKGYRIGDAEVSSKHANFIINAGSASAADIEALIQHVATRVEEEFGVRLKTEVRFLGEVTE